MLELFGLAPALVAAAAMFDTRDEAEKTKARRLEEKDAAAQREYHSNREEQIQQRVDELCAQRLSGKTLVTLDEFEELMDLYGDALNEEDYIIDDGLFNGFLFTNIEERVEKQLVALAAPVNTGDPHVFTLSSSVTMTF